MSNVRDPWTVLTAPPPSVIEVDGVRIQVGQRVRLRPRARGDAMDSLLAGRSATIDALEMTMDGEPHVCVVLDDDPGRDLGSQRVLGHRFFFRADELEMLDDPVAVAARPRILVAGIGNVFFGDDAFGVAVAQRLAESMPMPGVKVVDFGIRGIDLAYALQDDYDLVILVDAMSRGERPGTLYVIEPTLDDGPPATPTNGHGLDPVQVLQVARSLGHLPARIIVVGCEPASIDAHPTSTNAIYELTLPVAAALPQALATIGALIADCAPAVH